MKTAEVIDAAMKYYGTEIPAWNLVARYRRWKDMRRIRSYARIHVKALWDDSHTDEFSAWLRGDK